MATDTTDRLATVLYVLMRDHVPVGQVTRAVGYVEVVPDDRRMVDPVAVPSALGDDVAWRLTNEPLAALAVSLADRIRG